MNCDFF